MNQVIDVLDKLEKRPKALKNLPKKEVTQALLEAFKAKKLIQECFDKISKTTSNKVMPLYLELKEFLGK